MKKLFLLSLSLVVSLFVLRVNAQSVIVMEESGGVYKIPCLVNGARMKLVFDTGAATVCLSQSMAEYLLENDYLSKEDFVGEGRSVVADGRVVNHLEVILKDIEISGYHISDVSAVVVEGQQAPLLLGQSAIQKLGQIVISGNTITILNADNTLSKEEAEELFDKIYHYHSNQMYASAVECYEKLYKADYLSDFGLYNYALMLRVTRDYEKALDIMLSVKDTKTIIEEGFNLHYDIASLCFATRKFRESIPYFEKALVEYKNTAEEKVNICTTFAVTYSMLESYNNAADMYAQAFNAKAEELGVSTSYLQSDCTYHLDRRQKSVKDAEADSIYFNMLLYAYKSHQATWTEFKEWTIRLGARGNLAAQQHWSEQGIDCRDYY